MVLRSTTYQNEMNETDSSKNTSFVTSLMKSWRISSSSSIASSSNTNEPLTNNNNNNHTKSVLSSDSPFYSSPIQSTHFDTITNNTGSGTTTNKKGFTRKFSSSSQDGNFDAMAKQTISIRKSTSSSSSSSSIINNNITSHAHTSTHSHTHNSNNNKTTNSYSPLRYVSPSMTNLESLKSSFFRQHHTRNSHHNQYYHNTPGNNNSNNHNSFNYSNSPAIGASYSSYNGTGSLENFPNDNNNASSKYFQDLDEDWSAVIDDFNMPIPVMLNGGRADHASNSNNNSLSRISTNSSITNFKPSTTSVAPLQYPQLPLIETRSKEEIENEREIQKLNSLMKRITKFDNILNNKHIINLSELRQISWNGIPKPHRPVVWKLLIGYLPANKNRQESFLKRKRQEYRDGLNHTFSKNHKRDIPTWHQIEIDIPRTNPHIPLYQFKTVHESLQRILYLWAIRHPASGYVQGINDLVTPFYQTFLTEYLPQSQIDDVENRDPSSYLSEEQLKDVEADAFWCLTRLLEQITDNYIHGQPGILKQVKILSQLIKRIDTDLYNHFQKEHVEFIQFAFRWMNCLLMREFQMNAVIRMWDTYLSETFSDTGSSMSTSFNSDLMSPQTPTQRSTATFHTTPQGSNHVTTLSLHTPATTTTRFNSVTTLTSVSKDESDPTKVKQSSLNEFHVFVCAAFLIKWSDQLCEMDFQEIITFLQNPPTKNWDENDIEMLLSGAYIWQSLYKDATSHWL